MISNWLFWAIPKQYAMKYMVTLWFVMFIIPTFVFGMQFTRLGFVMNLIWYDIIWYGWIKSKEAAKRNDE